MAGLFFIWIGVTAGGGGFLTVMSVVFGLAIAVAAVTSCWLHR